MIFYKNFRYFRSTKLTIKELPKWIPDFLDRFKTVATSPLNIENMYSNIYKIKYKEIDDRFTIYQAIGKH